MIVVGTNVISELMRTLPDPGVRRWFSGLTEEPVATTAVTLAELMVGAICTRVGATLATRNVRDFDATGLTVVDPWTG